VTDRIANPWGERTPFGRDGEWPMRVDQFLEAGVSEEDVDRWVQTASILHSNGDALDIAVRDDRIVGVRGRSVDRVTKGRLDPKDLFGWQANNSEGERCYRSTECWRSPKTQILGALRTRQDARALGPALP
jgi:ferredoxin-nitrate reductase